MSKSKALGFIFCGVACFALTATPVFAGANPCKSINKQCRSFSKQANKKYPNLVEKKYRNITVQEARCGKIHGRFETKKRKLDERFERQLIKNADKLAACLASIFGIGNQQNCDKIALYEAKILANKERKKASLERNKDRQVANCQRQVDRKIAAHADAEAKLAEAISNRDRTCAEATSCEAANAG